jgi:hypothetical protein
MPSLRLSTVPTQTTNPTRVLEPTSIDTIVPSPTPLPVTDVPTIRTAAPLPVDKVQAAAWVSHARPGWGSVQTVFASLTKGGQGVADAQMHSIVHDKDADRRWPSEGFETTGEDGIASVSFIVVDAPADYIVNIDVYLVYEGITYQTGASFAPQC